MRTRTGILKIILALGFLFNINQAQQIKLLRPVDGEKINSLSPYYIKWEGRPAKDVKIEYTICDGMAWIEIDAGDGLVFKQYWFPPDTISSKCKIRITDISDSTNYDENEDFFTLYKVSHDFISINNCFMWIGNNGMGSHNPLSDDSGFYWNGGEDPLIASIFSDGLVWGGKINGEIRVNGNTYRHGLIPGRIIKNNQPDSLFNPNYKIFKIRKNWDQLPEGNEKERLRNDYENWPVDLGAPFNDVNGDGVFTVGTDTPKFIGDEVLFYVANDADTTTSRFTYGSNPIGLEFQTTVWGFDTNDFLKDVVFKKYKIINKSENTIEEMYLSYWTDDDLGFAGDDFVGCDTNLSLGYTYNGDNVDEDFYCENPPAVGHIVLQGPKICNGEIDSIRLKDKFSPGKQYLPISAFSLYISAAGTIFQDAELGNPERTYEMYLNMKGLQHTGEYYPNPITGELSPFVLSGDPVNKTGWYEGDGWPDGPSPDDRRFMISNGPFTMAPGDTQEVVYAIFMARGSDNIESVAELKKTAKSIHLFYGNEILVDVKEENNLTPTQFSLSQNYPNPFNPTTTIKYTLPAVRHGIPQNTVILSEAKNLKDFSSQSPQVNGAPQNDITNVELTVYDILGRKVATLVNKKQSPGNYEVEFNASKLASGMYFYRLNVGALTGLSADKAGSAIDNFVDVKKMMLLK